MTYDEYVQVVKKEERHPLDYARWMYVVELLNRAVYVALRLKDLSPVPEFLLPPGSGVWERRWVEEKIARILFSFHHDDGFAARRYALNLMFAGGVLVTVWTDKGLDHVTLAGYEINQRLYYALRVNDFVDAEGQITETGYRWMGEHPEIHDNV